jgi:alkyldihydroxyacetonephosphate synthase
MSKWWGWGDLGKSFPMAEKPTLWPWIRGKVGLKDEKLAPPLALDQVAIPPAQVNHPFAQALKQELAPEQLTTADDERLYRTFGKSFPNLFMARKGMIPQAPDMVVFPLGHDDVVRIIELANAHDVCVIPFGGGTNIVGGVDPRDDRERMIVSLDMRRMNRLLRLDPQSRTAVIEAGATGPGLEALLGEQGHSLGHFPDSFEYSTLGGWIATRSAGMQSDEYGKIEDMVVSVKMVTPAGTIVTRTVPASSAGPDLNRIICGSEGVLGVITEATMRVHRAPAVKDYRGFLFKSFEDGVAAAHECHERGFPPSMIRLQDSGETELAMHMKSPKKGLEAFVQKLVKAHLKRAGYTSPCIMVVGFEGEEASIAATRAGALKVLKRFGAFPLGASVGKTWSKDKFNIPYLRDYVMDYSVMCDVAETSTVWANVVPLYHATIAAVKERYNREWGAGYVGCHVSHTYETGACLYFTYAAKQIPGSELEQYYGYKKMVTDVFMDGGATLTHHHAVGYEHMPWMEREVSATGLTALRALKERLDPKGILNPGKLIPADESRAADVRGATDGASPGIGFVPPRMPGTVQPRM